MWLDPGRRPRSAATAAAALPAPRGGRPPVTPLSPFSTRARAEASLFGARLAATRWLRRVLRRRGRRGGLQGETRRGPLRRVWRARRRGSQRRYAAVLHVLHQRPVDAGAVAAGALGARAIGLAVLHQARQPQQERDAHAGRRRRVADDLRQPRGLTQLPRHLQLFPGEREARGAPVGGVREPPASLEGQHQQREQALLVVELVHAGHDRGAELDREAGHPPRVGAAFVEVAHGALVLQAAHQSAPHLPRQALRDVLWGQVAEPDGYLAEAHLFVLDQGVGHALEHGHVLRLRQLARVHQHPSEGVGQRAALGVHQLPLEEVQQRVHASADDLQLTGRRASLEDEQLSDEIRADVHGSS